MTNDANFLFPDGSKTGQCASKGVVDRVGRASRDDMEKAKGGTPNTIAFVPRRNCDAKTDEMLVVVLVIHPPRDGCSTLQEEGREQRSSSPRSGKG